VPRKAAAVAFGKRAVVAVDVGDQIVSDVGFQLPVVGELEYMLPS